MQYTKVTTTYNILLSMACKALVGVYKDILLGAIYAAALALKYLSSEA